MLNTQNDVRSHKFNTILTQIFELDCSHIFLGVARFLDVEKGVKRSSASTFHYQVYIILVFEGEFQLGYKRVLHFRKNEPFQLDILFRSLIIQSVQSNPFHGVINRLSWFYVHKVVDFKYSSKITWTQLTFYFKIFKNDLPMRYCLFLLAKNLVKSLLKRLSLCFGPRIIESWLRCTRLFVFVCR